MSAKSATMCSSDGQRARSDQCKFGSSGSLYVSPGVSHNILGLAGVSAVRVGCGRIKRNYSWRFEAW